MPATSQQQQKLFGLALAVKRGEVSPSEVSDEVRDIVDRMSEKDIEDFAGTSHKGLPKKVEQQIREMVREIMRERVIAEMSEEPIEEGKKRFNTMYGVGKAKYVVNYHDGKKKHKDGSDFFDIEIFKNQKDFDKFQKALLQKGFVEESVNEVGKGSNWAEKYVNDTNPYKKIDWYIQMGRGVEKKIKGKEFVIMSDGSALVWNTKTYDWDLYKPKRIDKNTGKPVYESVNEAAANPATKKFLKGMQSIKVNTLGGWMPGVRNVYWDKKNKKFWFVDFEGDHAEILNVYTLKQLDTYIKKSNIKLESVNEALTADPRKVYGGTGAKEGMVLVAQKGLQTILDLSKKNPSNVFLMSDDNYTKFGPYYVKNGKVAKYTVANPNYDLEKNKVRSLKVPSDVILKFKIVEGAQPMDEQSRFTATSKETGTVSIFKTKAERDAAVKSGSHEMKKSDK